MISLHQPLFGPQLLNAAAGIGLVVEASHEFQSAHGPAAPLFAFVSPPLATGVWVAGNPGGGGGGGESVYRKDGSERDSSTPRAVFESPDRALDERIEAIREFARQTKGGEIEEHVEALLSFAKRPEMSGKKGFSHLMGTYEFFYSPDQDLLMLHALSAVESLAKDVTDPRAKRRILELVFDALKSSIFWGAITTDVEPALYQVDVADEEDPRTLFPLVVDLNRPLRIVLGRMVDAAAEGVAFDPQDSEDVILNGDLARFRKKMKEAERQAADPSESPHKSPARPKATEAFHLVLLGAATLCAAGFIVWQAGDPVRTLGGAIWLCAFVGGFLMARSNVRQARKEYIGLNEAIRNFQPYYRQLIEEPQPARIAAPADEPSLAFGEDVAAEGEAMAEEENKV